jgi:ribose/xylose/arabinose/galactoside ABC-type transport system permease subunit
MTPAEYTQLRAFAGIDGLVLAIIWTGSFALLLTGLTSPDPTWAMAALMLVIVTPFYAAKRLRRFRDEVRDGIISFKRAWAYVILMFFFAGVVFALVQYAYFTYLDQGYFIHTLGNVINMAESEELTRQSGMTEIFKETLRAFETQRTIDIVLNILTQQIMMGMLIGAPMAAMMKSSVARGENPQKTQQPEQ